MQLLGQAGLRRIFANHTVAGSEDPNVDDDDDILGGGFGGSSGRRWRRTKGDPNRFPKVPSDEGRKLMDNGSFGSSEPWRDVLKKRKSKLARQLMYRELDVDGTHAARANKVISQV
jgi:WD repeat-containing protein 23